MCVCVCVWLAGWLCACVWLAGCVMPVAVASAVEPQPDTNKAFVFWYHLAVPPESVFDTVKVRTTLWTEITPTGAVALMASSHLVRLLRMRATHRQWHI